MTDFNNPTDADYRSYREYLIENVVTEEEAQQEATLRDYQNSNGVAGIADSRLSPLTVWRRNIAAQHYHRIKNEYAGTCRITGINYGWGTLAEEDKQG